MHLFQENLRYDKLAEALGGHGEYVTTPGEFRPALERAYAGGRARRPAVGDQLPGEEGILGSREVPARIARQDRARRDVLLPLNPPRRLTAALQAYADRGVFRGFRPRPPGAAGRRSTSVAARRPMRAVFDARRGSLTFDALFPACNGPRRPPGIERDRGHAQLTAPAGAQAARPAARRRFRGNQGRRLVSRGDGAWPESRYAVRHALNLVNELFLFLHESYPDT